jgi:hypothetical protein
MQLLDRGVHVRAIVRSAQRLPPGAAERPGLVVVEGDRTAVPLDRSAAAGRTGPAHPHEQRLGQPPGGPRATAWRDRAGTGHRFVRWVVVRPDTLLEGEVTGYSLHGALVDGLFKPGSTNMANVAHFMCELATDPDTWDEWSGRLPVVVNSGGNPR